MNNHRSPKVSLVLEREVSEPVASRAHPVKRMAVTNMISLFSGPCLECPDLSFELRGEFHGNHRALASPLALTSLVLFKGPLEPKMIDDPQLARKAQELPRYHSFFLLRK